MIEKLEKAGGNSWINGGQVAATGSALQKKQGIDDSPDLILEALNMTVSHRDLADDAVIHSQRDVQYRGNEYQAALKSHGLRCSMSRKANCWDNAVMEPFFSQLKVELIYAENYQSVDEARAGIFEYIELFYNRSRKHSAIGYVISH